MLPVRLAATVLLLPWLALAAPAAAAVPTCAGLEATVIWGEAPATEGDDVIWAGDGNDVVDGLGGDDTICTGAGNDTVQGGAGEDRIWPGAGDDIVDGGDFWDWVEFEGSTGVRLDLPAGTVTGEGADTVTGIEHTHGTPYDDVLIGDEFDNFFHGGAGNDRLDGGTSEDLLYGEAGDDVLLPRYGDDTADGGDGHDHISYADHPYGVEVDLVLGFGDSHEPDDRDELSGFELVTGSSHADVLRGGVLAPELRGSGGNDVLRPGSADDLLIGGPGQDVVDFEEAIHTVKASLVTGVATGLGGVDTMLKVEGLFGSPYADVLVGNGLANQLRGDDGADLVRGNGGDDAVFGGGGNDDLRGGEGRDTCSGGTGFNTASSCERQRDIP